MGTASKLLFMVVSPRLAEWVEITTLRAQGHTVLTLGDSSIDWERVDLILSEHAHRMDEGLREYLPLAIKEGRRRKYGEGKGKKK